MALHVAHVAAITRNNHHNQKSQHEMSFDLLLLLHKDNQLGIVMVQQRCARSI